jgi:hypothetical protein
MFVKDLQSGTIRDDRLLPALPTYKAWNNGKGGGVGAKYNLQRNLGQDTRMRERIQRDLTEEAREVARCMLDNSHSF